MMKALWKCFSCLAVLILIVSACSPAKPATPDNQSILAANEIGSGKANVVAPAAAVSNPIVTAVKVSALPVADGDASDAQWKDAPVTQIGGMQWSAVYTDQEVAFLIKWIDRDLSMDSSGNYIWDPATSKWSIYDGPAREWMNLAWDINTSVGKEGCAAFCHEDPPGSGVMHHQTAKIGEYADSWMLFEKHGFTQKPGEGGVADKQAFGAKTGSEDQGWLMGAITAKQNTPLVFETTNAKNPRNVIAGNVTFVDYAEDNIIGAPGDPVDVNRDRPRDKYCNSCHIQIGLPYDPLKLDYTFPDIGEVKYTSNWTTPYTAPKYMETKPTDFVDAMTITQAEVDNGEAVAVASLSPEQISQYWANYQAVNGIIPYLVLKTPSESMADLLVGSNWTNGTWTMEITRKLVTPYATDDVQFKDLAKDYAFSLTISNSGLLLGKMLGEYGGFLHFQK